MWHLHVELSTGKRVRVRSHLPFKHYSKRYMSDIDMDVGIERSEDVDNNRSGWVTIYAEGIREVKRKQDLPLGRKRTPRKEKEEKK